MKIRRVYCNAVVLALLTLPAQAEYASPIPCAPHAQASAALHALGEYLVVAALLNGAPFYIYANRETGTWTALVGKVKEGLLCQLAEGQGWSLVPQPEPGVTL